MLNLDLLNTRAGQDIYQVGFSEGEIKGEARGEIKRQRTILVHLLKKCFGKLSNPVQSKIKKAELAQLEQWTLNVLDAKTIE